MMFWLTWAGGVLLFLAVAAVWHDHRKRIADEELQKWQEDRLEEYRNALVLRTYEAEQRAERDRAATRERVNQALDRAWESNQGSPVDVRLTQRAPASP